MQLIIYLIIYPFLKLISLLPFPIFYFVSDFIYFFVYRIIKYRKKVVRNNLELALPHLSTIEKRKVEKKFYKHMCDMFLEMIKTLSISQKEMEKRFRITNMDFLKKMEDTNKSMAIMIGHYATYEWCISMNYYSKFVGVGIYKKIANPYFDDLVKRIRSRFRAELVTSKEVIGEVEKNTKLGRLCMYGFASDQTALPSKAYHWVNFMGHYVPAHTGAEMLAKRFDLNVIFLKVRKIKRGFYEADLELITDDAKSYPNYEITDIFTKLVEKQILEAPEYYLWTHKRWKYKK